MSKKERKELERVLVKTIGGVLNMHNTEATKSIKKIISSSSKTIAKKFYKTFKTVTKKSAVNTLKKPVTTTVKKTKSKIKR